VLCARCPPTPGTGGGSVFGRLRGPGGPGIRIPGGVCAVGPIGAPVAAISISGPASRMTKQRCVEFVPQMRRAASELSQTLRTRESTGT